MMVFMRKRAYNEKICSSKLFCYSSIIRRMKWYAVNADEVRMMADYLNELSESYVAVAQTVKETAGELKTTKRVWRSKNNSMLIKLGLALIAFPDPTISDILGAALITTGMIQKGIRRQTIYVEDVYKTFQDTLRQIRSVKYDL